MASIEATIPQTMKAVVIEEVSIECCLSSYEWTSSPPQGHRVSIKDHPVPPVGDDDVLIKTVSIAQNPTDWKRTFPPNILLHTRANQSSTLVDVDSAGTPGTILGCDFSGHVVKVGKNVKSPKIGDHVAGFVHGAAFPDEGAFAEFVKTPAELVWSVPENTLSHDEAATLGCAYASRSCSCALQAQNADLSQCSFWTAAQALYHPTRLGLVEPPAKAPGDEWILVYGGSCEYLQLH